MFGLKSRIMRKMFDNVSIRELDPEAPLPDYRILENRLYLKSSVDGSSFAPKASLGLEILIGKDTLEFWVRNQDDADDKKSYLLDLRKIPEWNTHRNMTFAELRDQKPETIESFLRRAFAQPHSEEWSKNAMNMGERIGVYVGNELGIIVGEHSHPHTAESRRLFAELAHIALGYAKEVKLLHRASVIEVEYGLR